MKKYKKGAALILTLFMLIIVSVFISLIFLISKNEINYFRASTLQSNYNQFLKETVDFVISPLILGNGQIYNPNFRRLQLPQDEFINIFNINDIQIPPNNIDIRIFLESNDRVRNLVLNIVRRSQAGSNLWIVSNVTIDALHIPQSGPIRERFPRYQLLVNTVLVRSNAQINNVNDFSNFVSQNLANIIWQGRARAVVVQRTPLNLAQNTGLFVKYSGLWVPFGANPFYNNLLGQGIDSCVGINDFYTILGDLSTPSVNVNNARFANAFDGQISTSKAGVTTIWQGTRPVPIIRGSSSTGYATISEQLNQFNQDNQEYSLRTSRLSEVNNNSSISNISGEIPGEATGNRVIDLDSISTDRTIIRIDPNQAAVVGQVVNGNQLGQIVTRGSGSLVEVLWPVDQNGNFVAINPNNGNDPNRQILNSYPPGYANVYIVPDGNILRLFAVGKYSGQLVPANELRNAIQPQSIASLFTSNGNMLEVDLDRLDNQQRVQLATIQVEGGNVVLSPSPSGNSTLSFNQNNRQVPFDLTVIATRLGNTDSLDNRRFYTNNNQGQPIQQDIGGWVLPGNNDFRPNNFMVNLGNNGLSYFVPNQHENSFDRRRQVTRALEGNVIIQDFNDQNLNGIRDNNERVGYVGFNMNANNTNSIRDKKGQGRINVISHNFVLLNYQARQQNRNNIREAGLAMDIISYRGSFQIMDEDSYRFLLDRGRFRRSESEAFLNNITTNDNLYWYGKYIGNFANIEGVLLQNGNVRGFDQVFLEASGANHLLPRTVRSDYVVLIRNRPVILFDIVQFQINR